MRSAAGTLTGPGVVRVDAAELPNCPNAFDPVDNGTAAAAPAVGTNGDATDNVHATSAATATATTMNNAVKITTILKEKTLLSRHMLRGK